MENCKIKQMVYDFADGLDIIMVTKFGSHLYGTDTAKSDTDIKGIFLPTKEMLCLGKIPKSINNTKSKPEGLKNTKDDIDLELYSLQYYINLATLGETVAIDMLHSNNGSLVLSSDIWETIQSGRQRLYTRNLKSFVGYARKQAAKYGIKGSRLSISKDFITVCRKSADGESRMRNVWGALPTNEHAHFIDDNEQGIKQYQICGKTIQETVTIDYACSIMELFVEKYGNRAKQAEQNKGIDFKAISHALRAAYQLREILSTGNLVYPLAEAIYLRDVKEGKYHYLTDVAPVLESLMDELDELTEKSSYPEKVDMDYWNKLVISIMSDRLF